MKKLLILLLALVMSLSLLAACGDDTTDDARNEPAAVDDGDIGDVGDEDDTGGDEDDAGGDLAALRQQVLDEWTDMNANFAEFGQALQTLIDAGIEVNPAATEAYNNTNALMDEWADAINNSADSMSEEDWNGLSAQIEAVQVQMDNNREALMEALNNL